ncbi:MAG: SDR family NAD(P)-dependent oxidoreductase [Pseudomonadota bacterium]
MSTVFITGAGSGIGREFVQQYLADGWTVVCTARQDAHLAELRDAGADCFNVDMQDAPGILKTAALLQDRTLDLAILNAGIMRGRDMGFADIHIEEWQESFFVNCIAPALWAGQLVTPLKRRPNGKLVALSSGRASIGNNVTGSTIMYRASKAALNATWKTLSIDEPDVISFVLHPGRVRTAMGSPESELSKEESVGQMRRVIHDADQTTTGRFLDYSGKSLPW